MSNTQLQKVYFKTFGCQMNVSDSDRIAGLLFSSGNFQLTKNLSDADVVIVNTCSVRKHAEDRALSYIGKLKTLKLNKENKPKIIVVGCFAQKEKYKLQKNFTFIDAVIGTLEYEYLPEILFRTLNIIIPASYHHFNTFHSNPVSVFIPIMYGCNNFCSFCIVPYVRGKEKSRPVKEILDEIKAILEDEVKEIVLIGQNVNSYQYNNTDFAQLLNKIATITTEKKVRIRFITNHPKDMSENILFVMKEHPNICKHIHLPLQSGDNRILQLMNRKYTVEHYIQTVETIRKIIPEIAITTDLIVGFPTETENEFENTYNVVRQLQFDSAFVFKYSPREGTEAAKLPDNVPKEVKEERHFKLLTLCETIARKINSGYINKICELLVETKNDKGWFVGKTSTNKSVEIVPSGNKVLTGKFVNVKITGVKKHSLLGEIVSIYDI